MKISKLLLIGFSLLATNKSFGQTSFNSSNKINVFTGQKIQSQTEIITKGNLNSTKDDTLSIVSLITILNKKNNLYEVSIRAIKIDEVLISNHENYAKDNKLSNDGWLFNLDTSNGLVTNKYLEKSKESDKLDNNVEEPLSIVCREILSDAFLVIPTKEFKIGFNWTQSDTSHGEKKFSILSIHSNKALIGFTGSDTLISKFEIRGVNSNVKIVSDFEGELELDLFTGLVQNKKYEVNERNEVVVDNHIFNTTTIKKVKTQFIY